MKSIAIFLLFIGFLLIIQGYYKHKYNNCDKAKTIIKYIPRTLYEEQLSDSERLNEYYASLFDQTQPNYYNHK
jgi:hypothetical protein